MSKPTRNKKEVLELVTLTDKKIKIPEVVAIVTELLDSDPSDTELLHARAHLYEKLQKWSEAINDYLQILSLDKNDKKAQTRVDMLKTILRYNNTDIYSSPNTNYDPWFE